MIFKYISLRRETISQTSEQETCSHNLYTFYIFNKNCVSGVIQCAMEVKVCPSPILNANPVAQDKVLSTQQMMWSWEMKPVYVCMLFPISTGFHVSSHNPFKRIGEGLAYEEKSETSIFPLEEKKNCMN